MVYLAKGIVKWIIYLIAAGLIFLGILFLMASYADQNRLLIGLVFIVIALILIYFSREKKPIEIKQTLEVSGAPKLKEIKCPNCSAILNPDTVQIIGGKPYMTCKYCGNKFEITEEPKW